MVYEKFHIGLFDQVSFSLDSQAYIIVGKLPLKHFSNFPRYQPAKNIRFLSNFLKFAKV